MPAYGADVDQLRETATKFNSGADSLESAAKSLSSLLNNGVKWTGPDASRFRSQWSGESMPSLNRVAQALRNASEELRRNADEQEQASAASGGTTGAATSGTGQTSASGATGAHAAPQGGENDGGGQTRAPSQGGPGVAEPSGGRDAYVKQVGPPDDQLDGMGAYRGECTSWAAFRRKELGLSTPNGGTGNGSQMAGKLGGTATTPPSLGAVVSQPGDSANPYGHVMIVEQTYPDGSFRVSEMNVVPEGSKNYTPVLGAVRTDRIWHPNADGTYTYTSNGTGYKSVTTKLTIAP